MLTAWKLCCVMFWQKSPVYQKIAFYSLFCLLWLCESPNAKAQGFNKVDSLKEELRLHGEVNRYNILFELAYELFDVDDPIALGYSLQAHEEANRRGIDSLIVKSGRLTGQLLRRLDRLDESIAILEKMKPIAEKKHFDVELARILNTLAVGHTFRAEYDKALEYHFQSLVMREKQGDKKNIAIALQNIGLAYYKMGNYDLAMDYYLQAQKSDSEAGNPIRVQLDLNLGLCFSELHQFENAQLYFESALKLCGTNCSKQLVMQAEFGLGAALFEQERFPEAGKHFQKSYGLSIERGDTRFKLENLLNLAKLGLLERNHGIAKGFLDLIDSTSEKEGYREILKTFYRLEADYYSSSGEFEKANYYSRKVNEVNDSIFKADVIKNLTRVQTQYAQRENLAIIAAKDNVLALNERLIKQQQSVTVLLLIIVFLTTALVIVVYRNYRKIKTVNAELASAKQIIEDHNKFLDQLVVKDKASEGLRRWLP